MTAQEAAKAIHDIADMIGASPEFEIGIGLQVLLQAADGRPPVLIGVHTQYADIEVEGMTKQ